MCWDDRLSLGMRMWGECLGTKIVWSKYTAVRDMENDKI